MRIKTSTPATRAGNYILTKLSAEQVCASIEAFYQTKQVDDFKRKAQTAKYSYSVKRTEQVDEDGESKSTVTDACRIELKVRQAQEEASVRVVELVRTAGSRLLFFDELDQVKDLFQGEEEE